MLLKSRITSAARASFIHLLSSSGIALLAATLVFGLWFPFPYREMSGGKSLFLLIMSVDIVCGPLLTMVIFNPLKPRAELCRDLGLVVLIQIAALAYGIFTVWQARPLFLVQEVDRFKVVMATDLDPNAVTKLPNTLKPSWTSGPVVVALRGPVDSKEREKVLMESVLGGRDYAERPEFYLPYDAANALKSLNRAKPLDAFLQKQPNQQAAADELAAKKGAEIGQWMYLPVIARKDWVAVLDKQGQIQGFLKGDGF